MGTTDRKFLLWFVFALAFGTLIPGVAMAIEEPEYEIVADHGDFEIRRYEPMILALDKVLEEVRSRDAEVVGVSVDSHYTHPAWKRTRVDDGGIGPIRYPLVSDLNQEIARNCGVLLEDGIALQGWFLIDRAGVVRHALVNDLPLVGSVSEDERMLDAPRFHEIRGDVCPANWRAGDEGIAESREGIVDYLSKYAAEKE